MPRSEQTQTAILGALSIMPMTGYALREEIRDTLGHFWSESFGQIYPALAELERQSLVERSAEGGSRSHTFALTPAGLLRLRELLAEPPQQEKPRNGLLLRLFFGSQLGAEATRRLVLDAREKAKAQLTQMDVARRSLLDDASLADQAPYILLTISAGEHSARASIAWANEALAELAMMAEAVMLEAPEAPNTPDDRDAPETPSARNSFGS
ncbi:PadR family transcriptional regulator [Glaciihabitans tibetensis]|uniref:PadR family transcriptional regulator n=1 Tax=Glaciihabitans tibetensis TaxID=1266600 RepID=A0A2T0VEH0_9MICO|nr:PadR family transcriptional regulator [Glaciihabitans tibetensis]PRY68595.1 PadR family transcriptional regulator [Glaciihabitans tibetensis]